MKTFYKKGYVYCLQFLSIIFIIFILYNLNRRGYEISVYDNIPLFIWILIFINMFLNYFNIGYKMILKISDKNYIIDFILLILLRYVIYAIPIFKGYYTWNGDNMSHYGYMIDILKNGVFNNSLIYPITSILISIFVLILNISPIIFLNISTFIISIISILGIYLITKTFLKNNIPILIATAIVSFNFLPTAGRVYFTKFEAWVTPMGWSILYLPFVFFILIKSHYNDKYKILSLIFIILYPFFHIATTFYLMMIIIILILIEKIKIKNINAILLTRHNPPFLFFMLISLLIISTLWIISFDVFNISLNSIYNRIIGINRVDVFEDMISAASKLNLSFIDVAKIALLQLGDNLIYLLISFIGLMVAIKSKILNNLINDKLHILYILLFITLFVYASYLFNFIPFAKNFAAHRYFAFTAFITPILSSYYIFTIYKKHEKRAIILFIVILSISSCISMFNLFPSPIIQRPSNTITQMDYFGYKWFLKNKNDTIIITQLVTPSDRFFYAILGYQNSTEKIELKTYASRNDKIPDHFNYDKNKYFGDSYLNDRYAVISKIDETIYEKIYKAVNRFSIVDFNKVINDHTVNILYSNGECKIWKIYSTSK